MSKKKAGSAEPSTEAILAVLDTNTTESMAAPIGRPPEKLPTLRELGNARSILDGWLAETEGEETPELADLFAKLTGDTEEKVERWGLYLIDRDAQLMMMQAEASFYAQEAQRLADRAKSFAAATERSRKQLQFQMEMQGIKDVKGTYCTVALQSNPPKCVGEVASETLMRWHDIQDPTFSQFVRYVPESFALDRAAVVKAARAGVVGEEELLPLGLAVKQEQRVVVK